MQNAMQQIAGMLSAGRQRPNSANQLIVDSIIGPQQGYDERRLPAVSPDPPEMVDEMLGAEMEALRDYQSAPVKEPAPVYKQEQTEDPPPSMDALAAQAETVGIDPEALRGLDLNATEARNFGYLLRMMEAENIMRELRSSDSIGNRMLQWLPGEDIERLFLDPDFIRYMNAQNSFAETALRSATGATINESEIPTTQRIYFPRPGDDDEVVADLQRQREALMMSLLAGSGPAGQFVPPFGEPVVPRTATGGATHRFNPETGQIEEIR